MAEKYSVRWRDYPEETRSGSREAFARSALFVILNEVKNPVGCSLAAALLDSSPSLRMTGWESSSVRVHPMAGVVRLRMADRNDPPVCGLARGGARTNPALRTHDIVRARPACVSRRVRHVDGACVRVSLPADRGARDLL